MPHILLVDDDVELTSLLEDILTFEGFTVSQANNGLEGLEAVNGDIDLILLDIMMPKMNGMEMLKKLREKWQTPVLFLTAKGEEVDRVIGLELGADDFLPKPFSDRELLARIRASCVVPSMCRVKIYRQAMKIFPLTLEHKKPIVRVNCWILPVQSLLFWSIS